MTKLVDIAEKLAETQQAIAFLEKAMAVKEPTPSVLATMRSLERRHSDLEATYEKAAQTVNLELCRYRVFNAEDPHRAPKLKPFATAMVGLQNVFSLVFDALRKDRPKQQSKLSAEAYQMTSFDLAYTFVGSLGVVLTLPAEREKPLFSETLIDEAMGLVFKLLDAAEPRDIAVYAKQLGPAPIRNLYQWVSSQANAGLGAEIQWKDREVKFERTVQYQDFANLKAIIEASGDEQVSEASIVGTLVGIDTTSRTFHMVAEGLGEIRGRLDDRIAEAEPVQVPKIYKALLRTISTISYALEKESDSYILLALDE